MNSERTEIIFLIDRSGSMSGLEEFTIRGFNSMMKHQCQLPGKTMLTTVLFDDQYEVLWDGVDAQTVVLTEKEYYVRGKTALLDAIGKTILDVGYRLSKTSEEQRPGNVIFVITTDGLENASQEFTYEKVRNLINHQQEKYHWEFIFLGANIDTVKEAGSIGIDIENAYSYETSYDGVEKMYSIADEAISASRALVD
ncbi:vWA domain-containing protein [Oceanobacillus salinisoli]|uniref:vWA domain-containing protein n=1 Tax=Oceanobacillus salinisoli TaxID=2678611 RepID=UPI0012E0F21F|nr:vWA domain-containing protein [Oceanobacillus salinisoli]